MNSVHLHVDGEGVLWALARCRVCRSVHKYLAIDAICGSARCVSCDHVMELQGAFVESRDAMLPVIDTDKVVEPAPTEGMAVKQVLRERDSPTNSEGCHASSLSGGEEFGPR